MHDKGALKALETFLEEAGEHLEAFERTLIDLEEDKNNLELVGQAFRCLHTIKGSGAMFGLDELVSFTHEIENVFESVRSGIVAVSDDLIEVSLEAVDRIRETLAQIKNGGPGECRDRDGILGPLKALLPSDPSMATITGNAPRCKADVTSRGCATYRIRFSPSRDIYFFGLNPIHFIEELSLIGKCFPVARPSDIPPLEDYNPEHNYMNWDVILVTDRGEGAIHEVFSFLDEDSSVKVDLIDIGETDIEDAEFKRLGDILVERGEISLEDLQVLLSNRKRLGEIAVESNILDQGTIDSALKEQQILREIRKERLTGSLDSTIRVSSEKLDTLVNLLGELVTLQANFTQRAEENETGETPLTAEDLIYISEDLERLTSDLHGNAMSMRMVPIGSILGKLKRHVRDLSRDMKREVVFTSAGAETELDKSVMERLSDPLMHLIRNCISHGIEEPAERESKGKPRQGAIHLSAKHSGANVLIEISDDGRGMDTERIRSKAVDMGIIGSSATLTEQEILSLPFTPAFTTAQSVTDISGRGVGMDVVKRNMEGIGGSVEVFNNAGYGCTITLRVPLTLAIIEGLLVKISTDYFVFPLAAVKECIEIDYTMLNEKDGRRLINFRGDMIPYIRLRERFDIHKDRPALEHAVVIHLNEGAVGFVVDSVVGKHQTVIKSMSRIYMNLSGVAGATILGSGSVALVLDAQKIYMDSFREAPLATS